MTETKPLSKDRQKTAREWAEFSLALPNPEFRRWFYVACQQHISTLKRKPFFGDEHILNRNRAAGRRWRIRNREKHLAAQRERARERRRDGRDAEYSRRYRQNPVVRLKWINRSRIHSALYRQSASKMVRSIVGCDAKQLRRYIESKFQPGMTWENQGKKRGTWQLDHIRPLASYDLSDINQQREAFHFTNLRPEWFEENSRKRSHWNGRSWRHADHKTVTA
jgi:hypothetical protein